MPREMSKPGMFRSILVAFDGSRDSVRAVELASSLALRSGAELTVVHVFASPSIALSATSGMPPPDFGVMETASREAGEKTLAEGVRIASVSGVKAKGELIEASSTVEAIVELSASIKSDLIVVGTRGMTGFKKLIIGSVSSGVVSHAHCPVLVVR